MIKTYAGLCLFAFAYGAAYVIGAYAADHVLHKCTGKSFL